MPVNRLLNCGEIGKEHDWDEEEEASLWKHKVLRLQKHKPGAYSPDWQTQFTAAIEKAMEIAGGGQKQLARIVHLEQELSSIRAALEKMQDAKPVVVPIATFAPEPFDLLGEIHAVVQPDGESFVASLFEANVNASGDTQQDAIANLKDMILATFETLKNEPKLGKGPARQLAVLRALIRRKE